MSETLSWTAARRIALRAQGMGASRRTEMPRTAGSRRAMLRALQHTHLFQIDSVNVFARAHHLPVYTRSGIWDPSVLDRAVRPGPHRALREGLAHEAAYTDLDVHELLDFRRRATSRRDWGVIREISESSPELFTRIEQALRELGPSSAAAVSRHLGDTERGEGWGWRRTASQWAVEYLFRSGALDCVGRNAQFERLYVPLEPAPDRSDDEPSREGAVDDAPAVRALVSRAARSLGIAEIDALADYFRLRTGQVRPVVEELLGAGELSEVEVNHPAGARTMLRHREAPRPTALRTAALVSPFDPIVFHRPRLKRLFDVDYRIGIYTPAARRTTGYYALLFLLDDLIPARVDLRADRFRGVLEVRGAYREPLPHLPERRRPQEARVLGALAEELERAARWQGLDRLEARTGEGAGELAAPLQAVLAAR